MSARDNVCFIIFVFNYFILSLDVTSERDFLESCEPYLLSTFIIRREGDMQQINGEKRHGKNPNKG